MANYRNHTLFNTLLGLPILLGTLVWYGDSDLHHLVIFGIVFIYSTLFMSPDLDLAYHIKPGTLRSVLALPFRWYARHFRHRGISHSIFLGSLTRIAWLATFVAAFLLVVCYGFHLFRGEQLLHSSFWQYFFTTYGNCLKHGLAGICCADWCHILVDHETSCW